MREDERSEILAQMKNNEMTWKVNRRLTDIEFDFIATIQISTENLSLLQRGKRITETSREAFSYDYYKDAMEFAVLRLFPTSTMQDAFEKMNLSYIKNELEREAVYICTYAVIDEECENEYRYKRWKFSYLDERREIILFTRSDITDTYLNDMKRQGELEEALDEAKVANEAKNNFLSRMSHDMRTPLNGILGVLHLAELQDVSSQMRDYFTKMRISGEYLLSLINDALDMSKIQSNRIELHLEPIQSSELWDSIIASIQPAIDEKQLTFDTSGIHIAHTYVNADKVRLQQIFTNILSNAVKFTEPGGRISLSVECIRRDDIYSYERFCVKDTGVGMSKEFLAKIYEPFEQEYNTITSKYAGTGLGMSIVKSLIELLNGTIQIQSEKNVGTTVTVCLPIERLTEASEAENKRYEQPNVGLSGRTVLYCEDNELNAEIGSSLLEMSGIYVDVAVNGREGVRLFSESTPGHYDAILMDIRMPVMDGLVATRTIRESAHADALKTPIIAMTANTAEDDVERAKEAGMNAHLMKPIDVKQMLLVLSEEIYKRENA